MKFLGFLKSLYHFVLQIRTRQERHHLECLYGERTKDLWIGVVDVLIDTWEQKGYQEFLYVLDVLHKNQFHLWPNETRFITDRLRTVNHLGVKNTIFQMISVDDEDGALKRWRKDKMTPIEEAHWELD